MACGVMLEMGKVTVQAIVVYSNTRSEKNRVLVLEFCMHTFTPKYDELFSEWTVVPAAASPDWALVQRNNYS